MSFYFSNSEYFSPRLIPFLIFLNLIALGAAIVSVIAMWKMFEKAGEEGWKSLIPFYNVYILYKIAWARKPGIVAAIVLPAVTFVVTIILMFAIVFSAALRWGNPAETLFGAIFPFFAFFIIVFGLIIADYVLGIICYVYLARAFGKSGGFAVGLIFLSVIFIAILGFGPARYIGPKGIPTTTPQPPAPPQMPYGPYGGYQEQQ